MTFIASVIAKEGVAIIADSLVTSSRRTAFLEDFIAYLESMSKSNDTGIKLDHKEVAKLFKTRPVHTKDFEDKLYQYGKYSAITTAGSANINGKRIKRLINEAIKKFKPDGKSSSASVEEKVEQLKEFITSEVKKYLSKNEFISSTVFILTSYLKNTGKTVIYKLRVIEAYKSSLKEPDFEYVSVEKQPDEYTVVCAGQNRLSERLLFGDFNSVFEIVPAVVNKMSKDFSIPADKIDGEYITTFFTDKSIMTQRLFEDMNIFKLTGLSLQQAVDLASLLMRIEIDIQKYIILERIHRLDKNGWEGIKSTKMLKLGVDKKHNYEHYKEDLLWT